MNFVIGLILGLVGWFGFTFAYGLYAKKKYKKIKEKGEQEQ